MKLISTMSAFLNQLLEVARQEVIDSGADNLSKRELDSAALDRVEYVIHYMQELLAECKAIDRGKINHLSDASKWIKFSDRWPGFTTKDVIVRGPRIGERKVKFQSAIFPSSMLAGHGFFFSDCVHPMQNIIVPMEDLEWMQ